MDMWKILALSCMVEAGGAGYVPDNTTQGGAPKNEPPIVQKRENPNTTVGTEEPNIYEEAHMEKIRERSSGSDDRVRDEGSTHGSGGSLPELLVRKSAPQVEMDPEATDSTDESWLASPDACVLLGLTPLLEELTCPTVAVIHKAERVVRSAFLLAREDPVTKIAAATLLRKAAELQTPLEVDTLWNLVGAYEEVGSDLLFCAQDDYPVYTAAAGALATGLNSSEG